MNKYSRLLALVLVTALALGLVGLVAAQDDLPSAGEGGVVIEGNQRGSGNLGPLMPLRCSGVDCSNPNGFMYPGLIGVSPQTQNFEVGVPNTLATGWEASEDGLTYTITLRDDLTWSDGEAITAEDVYFAWEVLQAGETAGLSSSYSSQASALVGAEIIDDYTITFSFEARNCDAVRQLALPVVPAHAYGYEVGADFDFGTLVDHPIDTEPTVTHGPFKFSRVEPGTAVYLEADQNYADALDGFVRPEGFVYLDVPDENVMVERFLSFQPGEPNFVREPDGNLIPTIVNSDAQSLAQPGRLWHYVAVNVADPNAPATGLDEDGNVVDQGFHPLLGDVRVRQALQHATNIDEIVDGPLNSYGTAMVSSTIPGAFTIHPELERRANDLDVAAALLDEAGFTDADGDGVRECNGCLYAEEGTPLSIEMMNVGDIRGDVAVILQDQWAQVGVEVVVQVLDFNTMYDTNMGAQIFDTAVAGWRGSLPFDPDQRSFFGVENDIASETAYGFNFGSFYNPRIEELGELVATGSCDPEEIKEAAWEMQEIFWEEQPYIWLYAFDSLYATTPNMANFAPLPNFGDWNIDTWALVQ